jgi:hypothetical protein
MPSLTHIPVFNALHAQSQLGNTGNAGVDNPSDAVASARHKHHPLNPMHINARQWIPPIGVANALVWGIANIAEHQVQDGHIPKGMLKPVYTTLAKLTPLINVTYGLSNAAGAMANGYAWRSIAFALYGLLSGLTAPWVMKDTQTVLKLMNAKRLNNPEQIARLTKLGQKLRPITTVVNMTVPIGALLGLFTVTKAAQAKPGLDLPHPHGNSFAAMINHKEQPLKTVLHQNLTTESQNWLQLISHTPEHVVQLFKDVGAGLRALVNPASAHVNGAHANAAQDKSPQDNNTPAIPQSAWQRFTGPLMAGDSVSYLYALTAAGRVGAALMALGLGLKFAPNLVGHSPYGKQVVNSPQWAKLSQKAMSQILLVGQFAGGLSALFTKFNGWPAPLSVAYRFSSVPYIVSGICSASKKTILGFDAPAWAKIGAFIQGSSYFANLWLLGANTGGQKSAANTQPDKTAFTQKTAVQ